MLSVSGNILSKSSGTMMLDLMSQILTWSTFTTLFNDFIISITVCMIIKFLNIHPFNLLITIIINLSNCHISAIVKRSYEWVGIYLFTWWNCSFWLIRLSFLFFYFQLCFFFGFLQGLFCFKQGTIIIVTVNWNLGLNSWKIICNSTT